MKTLLCNELVDVEHEKLLCIPVAGNAKIAGLQFAGTCNSWNRVPQVSRTVELKPVLLSRKVKHMVFVVHKASLQLQIAIKHVCCWLQVHPVHMCHKWRWPV
jgi:hypothetical protein